MKAHNVNIFLKTGILKLKSIYISADRGKIAANNMFLNDYICLSCQA